MVTKYDLTNSRYAAASIKNAINAELANAECWFEITDPTSRWFGSIGTIDMTAIHNLSTQRFGNMPRFRNTMLDNLMASYGCSPKLDLGKSVISANNHLYTMSLLVGYNGPKVYNFAKQTKQSIPAQYDLLGTEITPGAFVSASGGQGIYLGKVVEIFRVKAYHDQIRVRLDVIVDPIDGGYVSDKPTVNIRNIMVITPDIKQQAMISKLTKP